MRLQTQDGTIIEVTAATHSDVNRILHWKVGTKIPSGIDPDASPSGPGQQGRRLCGGRHRAGRGGARGGVRAVVPAPDFGTVALRLARRAADTW
jgi:hypothetical protein